MKIRMIELFAGYGSQSLAMKRLAKDHPEVEFEPVAFAEIDKYAIKAYRALHGEDIPNLGDVSTIDWSKAPSCDLMTYSFPCQSISKVGKQKGLTEGSGTTSSLLWECRRAIEAKRPKYLVMENVAALLSERFSDEFRKWCDTLNNFGYTNWCQILNARDYGVPQNRKRAFMVSIFGEYKPYSFPEPVKLEKRLGDILEDKPDDSLYLSKERVDGLLKSTKLEQDAGRGFAFKPKTRDDEVANTITTAAGSRKTDNFILENPVVLGWTRDTKGNIVDRHPVDVANCVTASPRDNTMNYVLDGHSVRKLSCRELYRLMDVDDNDIDILLGTDIPKTRHIKLAGNSIVVACLYGIFNNIFCEEEKTSVQMRLF